MRAQESVGQLEHACGEVDQHGAQRVVVDVVDEGIDHRAGDRAGEQRRRWVMSLQNDPVMVRLLGEHEPFRNLITRLYAILLNEADDTEARISAALFSGAIAGTVINPLVDDIDDDTLRSVLIHLTARMFKLPD